MRGYVYVVWSRATESGRVVRYCSVRVVGAVGSVLGNQGPGLPSLQAPDSPVPGLPWWLRGKQPACSAGNAGDEGSTFVRRISWRREWQPMPLFLSGESQGQRSLVGCSPWSYKESDKTKVTEHAHTHYHSLRHHCLFCLWLNFKIS